MRRERAASAERRVSDTSRRRSFTLLGRSVCHGLARFTPVSSGPAEGRPGTRKEERVEKGSYGETTDGGSGGRTRHSFTLRPYPPHS